MKLLVMMALLVLIPSVFALDWCGFEVETNTNCTEATNVLGSCSTYNVSIYNSTYDLVETKNLTQIGSTGVYYFTFLSTTVGIHKWIACDDSTGTINVNSGTIMNPITLTLATETQIDNIESDTNEIQLNQSNFITADVSSLATTAQLNANTTDIIDHGDINWITGTFAAIWDTVVSGYCGNATHSAGKYLCELWKY